MKSESGFSFAMASKPFQVQMKPGARLGVVEVQEIDIKSHHRIAQGASPDGHYPEILFQTLLIMMVVIFSTSSSYIF